MKKSQKTKTALTAAIASLALCAMLSLVGCVGTLPPSQPKTPAQTKFTALKSTQAIYGFSAASAGMIIQSTATGVVGSVRQNRLSLLAETDDATLTSPTPDPAPTPNPSTTPSGNAEFAELDGYMSLVGSLLGDGAFKTETQTSDRTEYAVKAVVSYPDINGKASQYVLYYNEIRKGDTHANSEESAQSEDEESKNDDESENDGDSESGENSEGNKDVESGGESSKGEQESKEKYSISGIMVIGESEYPLEGKRIIETEGSESENKTTLVVIVSETERIEVEQKTEAEEGELEQKYTYSTYKNNALSERTTFSFESEDGDTELKMLSLKNGVTKAFKFDSETEDGQEKIMIRIGDRSAAKKYRVNVTEENGVKRYTYTEVGKNSDSGKSDSNKKD